MYRLRRQLTIIAMTVLIIISVGRYFSNNQSDKPSPIETITSAVNTAIDEATNNTDIAASETETEIPITDGGEETEIPIPIAENSDSGDDYSWASPKTLQDHYDRHGGDFSAATPNEYAKMAHEFFENRTNYMVKVDEDGTIRIFDPNTNTFGAYNDDGTTRTFFKPSDGADYFDRQPGELS